MEAIKDFRNITFDYEEVSQQRAALLEYLTIGQALSFLQGLGLDVSKALLGRYLAEGKLNVYAWINSPVEVFPLSWENVRANSWLEVAAASTIIIKPGFIKIKEYDLFFSSEMPGGASKGGKQGEIFTAILIAYSVVHHMPSDDKASAEWVASNPHKVVLIKVSELLELAKSAAHLASSIEKSCIKSLPINASLAEENKRLEKENQQLKDQLAHKPTNSLYIMAGALIEMLTTERRNQSRLKIELQELGLKGFSEGSLNSNFAASNKALEEAKALKASKDGG